MKRYSALKRRFPAFYRQDLLDWRREQLGWTIQETARQCGENFETVRRVLHGKTTNKKAFQVCATLGIDWCMVHKLDLPESEFHLAVLNGNESNGSKDVG